VISKRIDNITHGVVYAENGIYAGWPANHGAWQWGDEFLVGFLRGKYKQSSMHNIVEPFELVQARSLDGGNSWDVETTTIPIDVICQTGEKFDISNSIVRVRGIYDHGGDYIDPSGCFFASEDRGKNWHGPHSFCGLENIFENEINNTSRTSRIDDLLFMSKADARMWGTDEVFCVLHDKGTFSVIGTVCSDDARAVMPSVAKVGDRLVVVCRRRKSGRYGGWIDAFVSDDGGITWDKTAEVGTTGKNNGNPPALIRFGNDALLCCYANRTDQRIIGAVSLDGGHKWDQFTVRDGGKSDIGYPQLFMRSDGSPVCVYYWADNEKKHQHIAFSKMSFP
jgi:hypothetical protein